MLLEQRGSIYSDLDSPYREKRQNSSGYAKKSSNDSFKFELFPKRSEQQHYSVKNGSSSQMQRIDLLRKEKQSPTIERGLKSRHSEQKRQRKIVFHRQLSQPQQISRQNSLNTENVANRLTSLEKCFDETRSIRLPYYHQTQNRLYQNEKFLAELECFQTNLSQIKKEDFKSILNPSKPNNMNKKNRLSETRPQKLKIHNFWNENVKKQKDKIFVEKVMKQKVEEYRSKLINQNHHHQEQNNVEESVFFQDQVSLSSQIQNLNVDIEHVQMEMIRLRKLKKANKQKLREVTNFFGFLY